MAIARQLIGIGRAHGPGISLSRTDLPLTNKYWPSALARVSVGIDTWPSDGDALTFRPDLDRIVAEFGAKHVAEPGEPSRPAPGSTAANVTGARSSPASVKATSGRLMARRRTTSRTATPARLKFLKLYRTEAEAVREWCAVSP